MAARTKPRSARRSQKNCRNSGCGTGVLRQSFGEVSSHLNGTLAAPARVGFQMEESPHRPDLPGTPPIRLSIRTKLLLGFGITLVMAVSVSAFAYRTASSDVAATDWVEHTNNVIRHFETAMVTFDDMELSYVEFLLTGSEVSRALYGTQLRNLRAQLNSLSSLTADDPGQTERVDSVRTRLEELHANVVLPRMSLRLQVTAGLGDESDVIAAASDRSVHRQFSAIRDLFAASIGVEDQLLAARTLTVDNDDTLLMSVLAWGTLATIGLGLLSAIVLSTSVGQPMARLASVAQAIAAGDLKQRINLRRRDEIGRAANAFDAMAGALEHDIQERVRLQTATESILDAAAEGIFGIDTQGAITMMNLSAERMTGHTLEDIRGQALHGTIHYAYPDGAPYPADDCPTRAALRNGEMRHVSNEVFWRKDGTPFPVEFTAVPIRTGGTTTGAVLTFHDISHQLAISRMKDEFISVVSHELRTPLTSIRASLGLLAAGMLGPVPERANRMLEVAVNNSDRLIRLVSDILDIERIESGGVDMQLRPDDASELVRRSIEAIAGVAQGAGVELITQTEPVPLRVDRDRILQTLTNLLSNAIKFSDRGSRVTVQVQRQNGSALFCVSDQGRGIPTDKLETIFGRFEQVDASDSRQKGGTGLGLAIARSIVQQHGGQIWAESTLGEGSTFYFTVPVAAA